MGEDSNDESAGLQREATTTEKQDKRKSKSARWLTIGLASGALCGSLCAWPGFVTPLPPKLTGRPRENLSIASRCPGQI